MRPLKTRPCTSDDISFDAEADDEAASRYFFKPAEEYESDIKRFYGKLTCVDENFELQGNYNTAKAKQLVLTFEICRDAPDAEVKKCFDYDTVIEPWLRRKFLFTLENRKLFSKEQIESDKIKLYSALQWHVVSPQIRTDNYFSLSVTELNLQDSIGTVGFEEEVHQIFDVNPTGTRLYDFADTV